LVKKHKILIFLIFFLFLQRIIQYNGSPNLFKIAIDLISLLLDLFN
jgi:hypothetical protein